MFVNRRLMSRSVPISGTSPLMTRHLGQMYCALDFVPVSDDLDDVSEMRGVHPKTMRSLLDIVRRVKDEPE